MSKYQEIRKIVKDIMEDGKAHTADELYKECKRKGIEVRENKGDIYNVIHQMKKMGEIMSDSKKGYVQAVKKESDLLIHTQSETILTNPSVEKTTIQTIAFDDFEIVKPAVRRCVKQIISVRKNGDLALNSALCEKLKTNKVEIHIKNDCSQIILVPGGSVLLNIAKNNRIKNYIICEKLEKKNVKFPVYYVGEWDEENKIWLGDLVLTNPNKSDEKR